MKRVRIQWACAWCKHEDTCTFTAATPLLEVVGRVNELHHAHAMGTCGASETHPSAITMRVLWTD